MDKSITRIAIALAAFLAAAQAYATDYTMSVLAGQANSGVSQIEPGVFSMAKDVTIGPDDTFSLSGVKEIRMGKGVCLWLEGKSDLRASGRAKVTRTNALATPKGINIDYSPAAGGENTKVANIDFEYASLRSLGSQGMDVENCTFSYANGELSSNGALVTGPTGGVYNITNCEFTKCTVPAIAGAATYYCGLNIKGCKFTDNNTSNTNKPQINLTVGGALPITIEDCTFIGTGRNRVGGIGVANLMSAKGENKVLIRNCEIRDHRYGVTGTGSMHIEVRDCNIADNNHETNPMNGGSGINFSGYNYGLDGVISGCHIENSLWGVTLVGCDNVSLGEIGNPASPGGNTFANNGNNDTPYDLYNNGTTDVMAQNNTWSVPAQTAENIESVIFHKADDASLGLVTYMPAKENAGAHDIEGAARGITFDGRLIHASGTLSIYSITGQKVGESTTAEFDARPLPTGIYIARCGKNAIKFSKR
ncbi:MAG: hypothetical protein NC102_02905 [Clostridium sp.]|nr:hypothetical protein [Clostridium sp.]